MISFNPGPSKVYDQVSEYLQDAFNSDVMSISHRSNAFVDISRNAIDHLRQKLNIPEDYTIMYTSSATENWEIISQSLVNKKTLHFYTGDFGKKWYQYASHIHPETVGVEYPVNEPPDIENYVAAHQDAEFVCLTHNETSKGVQVPLSLIKTAQEQFPDSLIAIDATSAMGGVNYNWQDADIWYASTQKCFGLPAGLGIVICSPRVVQKAESINERGHYNSFMLMYERIQKYQTNYTPNVLNIYLLMRSMQDVRPIQETSDRITRQAQAWYDIIDRKEGLENYITREQVRSETVITVKSSPDNIKDIKEKALHEGIVLGSGYGDLKEETFRIANFPALTVENHQLLQNFIQNWRPVT